MNNNNVCVWKGLRVICSNMMSKIYFIRIKIIGWGGKVGYKTNYSPSTQHFSIFPLMAMSFSAAVLAEADALTDPWVWLMK